MNRDNSGIHATVSVRFHCKHCKKSTWGEDTHINKEFRVEQVMKCTQCGGLNLVKSNPIIFEVTGVVYQTKLISIDGEEL